MLTAVREPETTPWPPYRRSRPVILTAAFAALAVGIWACWSVTVDDAYITYRYSANLADGYGATWNPGEDPVEGFTNFAWMLWHAPWAALGVPLPLVSKLTAGVCAAAIVWLLATEPHTRAGAAAAAGAFVLFLPTWAHIDSGLETAPFALVVLRAVVVAARVLRGLEVRAWELPSLLLLAGTLRPDGVLGVAPALAVWLVLRWRRPSSWVWTVAAAAVGGAYMIARVLYYGHTLPNTFYVKVGVEAATDGRWIQMTAATLLPLLALTVAALLRPATTARAALAMATCAALWVIPALSAPAMDYLSRFAWHGFPVLCLAAAWALDNVESRRVAAIVAGGAVAWTAAAGLLAPDARTLVNYGVDLHRAHVPIGLALADTRIPESDRSVAVTDAGAIPYFSGWRATDYIGLNDERIAHGTSPAEALAADDPTVLVITSDSENVPEVARGVETASVLNDRVLVDAVQMRSGYYQLVFAKPFAAAQVEAALERRLAEAPVDDRVDPSFGRWIARLAQ